MAHFEIPNEFKWLFWDCDEKSLSFNEHSDFIISRFLAEGDWDSIKWLRSAVGDSTIRDWFLSGNGRKLDPRRLRFWGLILDLPKPQVDIWVETSRQMGWHSRRSA